MGKAARLHSLASFDTVSKKDRAPARKKQNRNRVQVPERLSFFDRREWIAFSISFVMGAVLGSGALLGYAFHLKAAQAQASTPQSSAK
jgi:hypothetical protein